MRLAPLPTPASAGLPLWPPLLASRGPGGRTARHAHHAMHLLLALRGRLRVRLDGAPGWRAAAGVLTAPDAAHAIDGSGCETLLVFVDPESDAGRSLRALLDGPVRLVSEAERDLLARQADPRAIMLSDSAPWVGRALEVLRAAPVASRRAVHPRVRRLLRLLAAEPALVRASLVRLARAVDLSPGRLMHVFTESIGIPLRPYLAWLKLQRAGGAIAAGRPLGEAAYAAGFADAAHMTRTFRRMLGMTPSALRARLGSARPAPGTGEAAGEDEAREGEPLLGDDAEHHVGRAAEGDRRRRLQAVGPPLDRHDAGHDDEPQRGRPGPRGGGERHAQRARHEERDGGGVGEQVPPIPVTGGVL